MPELATTILEHSNALAARARSLTGDLNEASFLVGQVMLHAFRTYNAEADGARVREQLNCELEALAASRRIN